MNLAIFPVMKQPPKSDELTWVHVQIGDDHVVSFRAQGTVVFDHYLFAVERIEERQGVVDVFLTRKFKNKGD